MESADVGLLRGAGGAHPASPIDPSADPTHTRPLPGSSGNSLSLNAVRQAASPRPPPPPFLAVPQGEVLPEEEELDPFDIVLQQDAAASTSQYAGTHSPSGATPPLMGCAGPSSSSHHANGGGVSTATSRGSPGAVLPCGSKRLPSVAGVCQASALTQNREQCARLIHQMTSILRGEINLHGQPPHSAAGVAGSRPPTSVAAAAAAAAATSPAAAVVASPGGDPRATSSPGAPSAAALAAAATAHNFEEELSLLTDIILEANLAHNPQWAASLPRGGPGSANGYISPPHVAHGSPRGAAQPHSSSAHHARSHSRGSPGVPYVSMNQVTPLAATANMDGRSTIDTEVSDSLCRLSHLGGGGGSHHHLYAAEYDARPMNPCQGTAAYTAAGGSGSASRLPGSASAAASWSSLMSGTANVGHLDRAAIASLTSQQSARRANGSAARSTSATVKHPRAVKPDPRDDLAKMGRIRGPRSRTGKNVAPSNHSAFSECSGGETRSCRSTLTGAHRVLSSSVNATTNTSMSSSVFHHIQGDRTVAAVNGDRRE